MRFIVTLLLVVSFNSLNRLVGAQVPKNLPENTFLNFTQLAKKYGQPSEEHDVITEDGYILKLFRIPGNRSRPVFFQHGIFGSADDVLTRGKTSIGIALAEAGYDVWFGNSRGNKYSRRHLVLNPDTDSEFFQYSFQEYGYFDTAACIDFILKETGQKKISAIGHSEGSTMFWVLGATRPEYNEKINVFIALAPICFFNHLEPPLSTVIKVSPLFDAIFSALGIEELIGENSLLRQLIFNFCTQPEIGYSVCLGLLGFPIVGYDPEQLEPEYLPVFLGHYPISTSRKNVIHFTQVRLRRQFAMYDYGPRNLVIYKSLKPPEYDLGKVNMNVVLIAGRNDKLAPLKDVDILNDRLPNVVEYYILKQPKFNHIDFIHGRDTYKVLYPKIFEVLRKFN